MAVLHSLLVVLLSVVYVESQCQKVSWTWPYDYQLLSTNDPSKDFKNTTCDILHEKNKYQHGKFFCFKSKLAQQPMEIQDKPTDDPEQDCIPLPEAGDLLYKTKYLCLPKELNQKLQLKWNFIWFSGFDHKRCVGFEAWNLVADMWANNYLCSTKAKKTEIVGNDCSDE